MPESSREYIILTGGVSLWQWEKYKAAPHDNWWMNFVRASRIRIQQIEQENPNAQITWLVYRPAYVVRAKQENNDLIAHIESVRDAFHVKLDFLRQAEEVINYLNYGQTARPGEDRGFRVLRPLEPGLLDVRLLEQSRQRVEVLAARGRPEATAPRPSFTKDAFVKSWSCHTGESMSQKFHSATGVAMNGAIGKTQYMTDELPILSTEGGRWVK